MAVSESTDSPSRQRTRHCSEQQQDWEHRQRRPTCKVMSICWAEAPIKIARMTLTIKLDGNWSSFQLANSAPPLSVTGSAIAPSARMLSFRAHLEELIYLKIIHGRSPSLKADVTTPKQSVSILKVPRRVRHTWRSAMPRQRASRTQASLRA